VVIVAVVVVVGRGSWVACVVVQYKFEGEQSIFKSAGPAGHVFGQLDELSWRLCLMSERLLGIREAVVVPRAVPLPRIDVHIVSAWGDLICKSCRRYIDRKIIVPTIVTADVKKNRQVRK
jgi:hypothetical protein